MSRYTFTCENCRAQLHVEAGYTAWAVKKARNAGWSTYGQIPPHGLLPWACPDCLAIMRALPAAQADITAGRTRPWEEVKRGLGIRLTDD